jgi:hypothetical protein
MKATVQEKYQDNLFDRLFIWLFSIKIAKALGKNTHLSGYDGFVDLSKQVMQGHNAKEQQKIIAVVLGSLVPAPVLLGIRTLFSPTQLVCELNAWFATRLFEWLVGPCQVTEVEIIGADGQPRIQKSGVHIEACRYLEYSNCVGMCVNMCKLPTQDFFTKEFGIPLTMTPNFTDLSCEMVFGQVPPPLESEVVYNQPCLVSQCATASPSGVPCPKVRDF